MKTALLFLAAALLLPGCSNLASREDSEFVAFKSREDYQKTSEVYRNESLVAKARTGGGATRLRVDLSDQRAQLLVDGKVAVDTPVCTGKAGKGTPVGTFPIKEKLRYKRSTIFGSLYRRGRQIYRGDRRRYRGRHDRFVGSSLPYWMRLTNDGVGLHASNYVHRYPKSNGCIRVPQEAITAIFSAVEKGTPVTVER